MNLESFCDVQFKTVREVDNIGPMELQRSLSISENYDKVFKAGEGEGRSGSFFFFTFDNRFLIKTLTSKEFRVLKSLVKDLADHFSEN